MTKRGFESIIDIRKFIIDCESCCFECGSSDVQLTKLHDGVAVCPTCLKTILEDYELKGGH